MKEDVRLDIESASRVDGSDGFPRQPAQLPGYLVSNWICRLLDRELPYPNIAKGSADKLQPSQLILTSVRPKFWLPPLELAWGVLTGMPLARI
jgi:hypothetical protein